MTKTEIFFFPDYRRSNPYQKLMYDALPDGFRAQFGQLKKAHDLLRSKPNRRVIFHLHWTAPIFQHCEDEACFQQTATEYLKQLHDFKEDGGFTVWTIHNILPHNRRFPDTEIAFRTFLAQAVDRIHVHEPSALEQITKHFPIPKAKVTIGAHGHFLDAYPKRNILGPRRRHFDFKKTDIVAGVIGQLRPNKGIEDLINAAPKVPNVRTFIAGRVMPPNDPQNFTDRCQSHGIICKPGFIRRRHLTGFIGLADILVLPYREVLTSGSLVLALSQAKPIIVPNLPSFQSLNDCPFAFFYTPNQPDTLAECLRKAAALGQAELLKLGKQAQDHILSHSWNDTAKALFADIPVMAE